VVFCLAEPDANAFAERFGGERLAKGGRAATLKTSRRPERSVEDERKPLFRAIKPAAACLSR
jgi:hypothetical protein